MLTKIETKLNKNNKYRDQIEYKILTLTRGVDMWTFKKKFKKIQKNSKKFKKKNNRKVTLDSHCS